MLKLKSLISAKTKPDFANSLKIDPVFLTHCLYIVKPENQYQKKEIDKKSGGKRTIYAPSDDLKSLQSSLSELLLDCIDEINKAKFSNSQIAQPKFISPKKEDFLAKVLKIKIPSAEIKQPALSHGFVRKRSIITNAMMHLGKKNVLNIDLENFFDSFNFGRVRGFFIKNKNFQLDPKIATMIAQIACYKDILPQGSPCSPVITNLITHSLDIRLSQLAKKHKCTYTRYADDITFSTRKSDFPSQIMKEEGGAYTAGKRLRRDIAHAGFSINENKTRIQCKDSRQDVTGLIVNKKPNTKKEYWRKARAKCYSLFTTGKFISELNGVEVKGNLNELEGQLNFIDQLDHYNRMRQKTPLMPEIALKKIGQNTTLLLSGREKTFSRFLFYRLFYANDKPTILCEGKTDNVYLKSAISELKEHYSELSMGEDKDYQLLLRFVEYSKRTRFLLELFGGTAYLGGFIKDYESHIKFYKAPKPQHPTIIFLDNDKGSDNIIRPLKQELNKKITIVPFQPDLAKGMHLCDFIHVVENLYVVFTPLGKSDCPTDIEYFFDDAARLIKHPTGLCFNTVEKRNPKTDLSKDSFANHIVKAQKKNINFEGFKPLLDRVVKVIKHYDSIK